MATISNTGEVMIPEPIREALGLEPGSEVVFEYQGNGSALIHKKMDEKPPATRFDRLYGSLKGGLTTDEIMAMTRGED
jgi:AbrB family looped-hinge helix DNA binding protein